jgi:uncharacterized Tic20 family protein
MSLEKESSILTGSPAPTQDEKTWGMIAHLSGLVAGLISLPFLGPLIVMLTKGKESRWVEAHAKEALNLQIIMTGLIWFGILGSCLIVPLILAFVAGIGALVVSILAAIKANSGEMYRYPAIIRIVK